MTDTPKTLALDANEWKALLLDNIARAHKAVSDSSGVNAEGLAMLCGHLDRIKGIAAAWHASQPPAPVAEAAERPVPQEPAPPIGAAAPKRKGGWPAGKPRKKSNAPAQAVQ